MRNKLIIILGAVICSLNVFAQDMHFTQFYASRLYLNPAFTGAGTCSKATMTYRNQWPGVHNGYVSYLFSYDHYLYKEKTGIGLMVGNDVSGSGSYKKTTISGLFAYETPLSRKVILRFGVAPSVGFASVDYTKLLFGDQIVRSGGLGNVPTIETPYQNVTYFDVSAGTLLYGEQFWAGLSAHHLFKPVEGLIGPNTTDYLPRKFSFHGGYKFLVKDAKDEYKKEYISPAINYRGQQEFDQVDIGGYFMHGIFSIGLWYRGIQGLKAYAPGYSNHDSFAFILGLQNSRFNMGYSYDLTISQLTVATQGAHELTMAYNFCDPNKKRKRSFPVHCPKF